MPRFTIVKEETIINVSGSIINEQDHETFDLEYSVYGQLDGDVHQIVLEAYVEQCLLGLKNAGIIDESEDCGPSLIKAGTRKDENHYGFNVIDLTKMYDSSYPFIECDRPQKLG